MGQLVAGMNCVPYGPVEVEVGRSSCRLALDSRVVSGLGAPGIGSINTWGRVGKLVYGVCEDEVRSPSAPHTTFRSIQLTSSRTTNCHPRSEQSAKSTRSTHRTCYELDTFPGCQNGYKADRTRA